MERERVRGGERREKEMGRKPFVKNDPSNFAAVAQCCVVSTSGPRPSVTNLLKTAMSTTSDVPPSTY